MTHITVNKEGVASFEMELDLKDPQSKVSLCKVRLGASERGGLSRGGCRSWGRGLGGPGCPCRDHGMHRW